MTIMAFKLPKKKTFLTSFLLGCLITWLTKEFFTSLLFSGMAFDGRSVAVKAGLLFVYTLFFTFIILAISLLLAKPNSRLGSFFVKQLNDDRTLLYNLEKNIIFCLLIIFFIIGNIEILPRNVTGFPQNGRLQRDDLSQLIQNANYSETENFTFGEYSSPQNMVVVISPDIITQLNLKIDKIRDTYKPFREIKISSSYPALLKEEQMDQLKKESRFTTWRQLNGNLYYYFLPAQYPENYYVTSLGSDIVFLPEHIFDDIFKGIN